MLRARLFITALLVLINLTQLFATNQKGDILIVDGQKWCLCEYPLEFLESNVKEDLHSDIDSLNERVLDNGKVEVHLSSSCWRGYIAEWVIENGRLCLNQLYDCDMEPLDYSVLRKNLNKYENDGKIYADWLLNCNILAVKTQFDQDNVRCLMARDGRVSISKEYAEWNSDSEGSFAMELGSLITDFLPSHPNYVEPGSYMLYFKRISNDSIRMKITRAEDSIDINSQELEDDIIRIIKYCTPFSWQGNFHVVEPYLTVHLERDGEFKRDWYYPSVLIEIQ